MPFEFAKFTEITQFAQKHNPEYKTYTNVFVCPDVNDFWIARILPGYNQEYEKEEGKFIVERNKIPMDYKGENINSLKKLRDILDQDEDLSNWDIIECESIEKCIQAVNGGFGILQM